MERRINLPPAAACPYAAHFDRLVEVLAPDRRDLVVAIEAYFDESGSHDGSPAYSVAGFAFERDHARQMRVDWAAVLESHGLSAFHMADFAPGNGPYKHLCIEDRIAIQIELQAVLYRHAAFGFAVSARASKRQDLYGYTDNLPNAFSLCCSACLATVNDLMRYEGYSNKNAAFFFESGNKHQADAGSLMRRMCAQRADISCAFVSKLVGGGPIQAADMFAWLQNKYMKSRISGKEYIRADLRALADNVKCICVVLRGFQKGRFIELVTGYRDYFPGPSSRRLTGTFGGTAF